MKFSQQFFKASAQYSGVQICSFLLLVLALLLGCTRGNNVQGQASPSASSVAGMGSGTYALGGSTTVDPIIQLAIEGFRAENPSYRLSYDGVGSSNGVKGVLDSSYVLGGSSRELKGSEESAGVEKISIAHDGMAVVTHKSSAVDSLSGAQIKDIFTGKIANWSEVGGSDAPIVVFVREESSGTRASFDELALDRESPINSALVVVSNGDMALKLSTTPNAIGYIGLGYLGELQNTAQAVLVGGYPATEAEIAAGNYPLARNLYMVYIGALDGFKKTFTEYLLSVEGQDLVAEAGFIPVH